MAIEIKGRVNDFTTREPLESAIVAAENKCAITNEKGEFIIETTKASGALTVSYLGYKDLVVHYKNQEFLNIFLEPSVAELTEIVVQGFENRRRLVETAGGISTLSSADIQRFDNSSIMPALNLVPGVRMESQGPGGSARLSIRGSLLRSPWGIRGVKAYWNDIPLSDAGGNMPYDILEPSILGNIEILKGPAGSIYGAGTGGVIIFNTAKAPPKGTSIEGLGMVGSFGMSRFGSIFRSGTENANISISYIDQSFDGFREQNSTYRKVLNVNGSFWLNEKSSIFFNAYNVRREFQLAGALTQEEYEENPQQALPFAKDGDTRLTSEATNVSVSHEYRFTENFSNTTSIYGTIYNLDHPWGTNQFFNGYTRGGTQGYGARSRFTYAPKIGNLKPRLVAGTEYQNDLNIGKTYTNNLGRPGRLTEDLDVQTTSWLLFGQAEIDLPKNFIFTAGLSYNNLVYNVSDFLNPDSINQSGRVDFGPKAAPRVALVKMINSNVSVHGSISYGFSPPTRNEINVQGQINHGLLAERGMNYEVGSRGRVLKRRLSYDLTAYTMRLNNLIIGQTNIAGNTIYENAGTADQKGIEASLSYNLVSSDTAFIQLVRPFLNYTFNEYRFQEYRVSNQRTGTVQEFSGNFIPGISPHVAVVGADVVTKPGIYLYLTYSFFDKRYVNNANDSRIADYHLLSARTGFKRSLGKHFEGEIYAGADNILDQKYVSFLAINAAGGRYYQPGLPRNYYSGISLKYKL
ncbi:MAG: TonB-dependent receptor domain-containing protein [Cytophagaceae bacterium]